MTLSAMLPDYRTQSPEVAARFAKIKERPVVLEIEKLGRQFAGEHGPVTALRDISLKVHRREFVCVIGPSGCGKSTLIRIVAGLDDPTSGRMLVDGKETSGPCPERGLVFQGYTLFPWLTVKKNVMFGLEMAGRPGSEAEGEARQWIDLVGLSKFADTYPHQLSGGMKQRVAIARGLVQNPAVLLMDEPFASLDEQTRMVLGDELLRIWSETRKTVLFVTHSLNEAVYLADRVVVLSARPGRVVDDVPVDLPRPRSFAMTGSERFGALKDRIWQHIKSAERR